MDDVLRKDVEWLGSTLRELRGLPEPVQDNLGFALFEIQIGKRPASAKSYSGSIQELREHDDQNRTYRLVYVATFDEAVYVLHVFAKKSTQGISTLKHDQDLIAERYKEARRMHAERVEK